jgi:hypothetical protein
MTAGEYAFNVAKAALKKASEKWPKKDTAQAAKLCAQQTTAKRLKRVRLHGGNALPVL